MSVSDLLTNVNQTWKNLYINDLTVYGTTTIVSMSVTDLTVTGNLIATGASGTTTLLQRGNTSLGLANNDGNFLGPAGSFKLTNSSIEMRSTDLSKVVLVNNSQTTLSSQAGFITLSSASIIAQSATFSIDLDNTRVRLNDTTSGNSVIVQTADVLVGRPTVNFYVDATSLSMVHGATNRIMDGSTITDTIGTSVFTMAPTTISLSSSTNQLYMDNTNSVVEGNLIQGPVATTARSKYLIGSPVSGGLGKNMLVCVAQCSVSGGICTITAQSGGISSIVYAGVGSYTVNLPVLSPIATFLSAVVMTNSGTYGPNAMSMCYRCLYPDINTVNVQTFHSSTTNPLETITFDIWVYRG